MSEVKYTLNPLANSFVPTMKPACNPVRDIARKQVSELLARKRILTKEEMANLVGQLITLGLKKVTTTDLVRINQYLNSKILHPKSSVVKPATIVQPSFQKFDLSKVQLPELSFLLVAFWGLYRHEQAQRPLLSLTYRPEIVKDEVWSVDASDKPLWNQSSVLSVCECPPMFGYTIPPIFFGNPFHLKNQCCIEKIHLNHYAESTDGNEFILTSSRPDIVTYEQFQDLEVIQPAEVDIYDLRNEFAAMLAQICDLFATNEDELDSEEEDIVSSDSGVELELNYCSLWDDGSTNITYIPFSQQDKNDLIDDDDHALLELEIESVEFEVPHEIKEMIRKCFSPTKDQLPAPNVPEDHTNLENVPPKLETNEVSEDSPNSDIVPPKLETKEVSEDSPNSDIVPPKLETNEVSEDSQEIITAICDPPCSIWCDSAANSKKDSGAETLDLISLEQLRAGKQQVETVITLPLKPFGKTRPTCMRSLSVNDCDPDYFDSKFGLNDLVTSELNMNASKDALAFLKKDPVSFFKKLDRNTDVWKDTDSGFVSHWSSNDDLLSDRLAELDIDTIWSHVSGEDSLWTPLPECVESDTTEMPLPHKRVRDLRRQRSVS